MIKHNNVADVSAGVWGGGAVKVPVLPPHAGRWRRGPKHKTEVAHSPPQHPSGFPHVFQSAHIWEEAASESADSVKGHVLGHYSALILEI